MKSGELAKFTADAFFEHVPRSTRKELLARLRLLFDRVLARATAYELQQLDALVAQARAQRAPPSGLVDWLRERGGTEALMDFVTARVDEAPRVSRIVDSMITGAANRRRLLEAAIRLGAGRPDHGDDALIQQAFDEARHKESAMGTLTLTFTFDPRGLPVSFDQAAFLARVNQLLATTFGLPPAGNENTYAAIMGILLLNEQTDQGAVTFRDAVGEAWNETLVEVLDTPKTATTPEVRVSSRVAYDRIAAVLATTQNLLPIDPATKLPTISFQQFASTARFVISKADDVFLSHPNLPAQIRIGLDQYVAGPPLFEALDLPPLGDDAQIVDDNVRSVGIVAACYFLERTRILDVLDAITSEFVVGKVPIGFDSAGRALDDYRTIPRERLLTPGERNAVYSRVLGFSGGDVPRDVLPNRDWVANLDRFIAAVAEYDRQRRVALFFNSAPGNQRPLSYTGELVRKAGNDLGRISSLYGYAGTQFDARRIADMVQRALRIMTITSLQRAYGVTNPYQLIERVASSNLGQSVNVVKYKTMAESVKGIMDIIARYAPVWSRTGGTALFNDDVPVVFNAARTSSADISDADRDTLITLVQYWLAVTGTGDQQIEKLSQPAPSLASPSIPQLYGGGNGQGPGDANAIDKIRQLVSAGSTPSLEQLQQLLPAMRA